MHTLSFCYVMPLRRKCTYSELFWSAFSRIRTENGEILRISHFSVQMRENADQNNSQYGHFSRSVHYKVSELCIGGTFYEDCFCWYSQQIVSAVTDEFLIPCNLIKRAPEKQNLYAKPNAKLNQIKKM